MFKERFKMDIIGLFLAWILADLLLTREGLRWPVCGWDCHVGPYGARHMSEKMPTGGYN